MISGESTIPAAFWAAVPPPSGMLPVQTAAWPPMSLLASTRITDAPFSLAIMEAGSPEAPDPITTTSASLIPLARRLGGVCGGRQSGQCRALQKCSTINILLRYWLSHDVLSTPRLDSNLILILSVEAEGDTLENHKAHYSCKENRQSVLDEALLKARIPAARL